MLEITCEDYITCIPCLLKLVYSRHTGEHKCNSKHSDIQLHRKEEELPSIPVPTNCMKNGYYDSFNGYYDSFNLVVQLIKPVKLQ